MTNLAAESTASPFLRLAQLGERLENTSKRNELAALLADFLQHLALQELPAAVRMTIGQVFPEWDWRTLNISWKAAMAILDELTDAPPGAGDGISAEAVDGGEFVYIMMERFRRKAPIPPTLTILGVYQTFEEIAETAGKGSRARKEALLQGLLQRATPLECKYLAKLVYQEMRHGVSEGVMLQGIAQAAGIKPALVRRANQLWGDVGEVALVAMSEGKAGLERASVRLFRPIKPMLAQTADSLSVAFDRYEGQVALEYKLDGARVQIHRQGDTIRIYSRNLADVTDSLPDVVAQVRHGLLADEAVLEGEAVAVGPQGRPLPFQHLMRRFRRRHAVENAVKEIPIELYLFDALYIDGRSLVDVSAKERWSALEQVAGPLALVRRLVPQSLEEGKTFSDAAYRDGHEGVMAKDLASPYSPGVRGKSWLKLKHVISLDLVIVAADWGYGRRHGWLSNYHLAARDEDSGEYLVVGKTFKGLTDVEFRQMTERLLALELSRESGTVFVQPKVVVEVLFNEIQASSQYKSGLALRFARISRLREDKSAAEADTMATLCQLFDKQFEYKGRPN